MINMQNQLNKFCLAEIEKNLRSIEENLNKIKDDKTDDDALLKILNSCQRIEDLAMVYGYDGVENLIYNLSSAVATIASEKQSVSPEYMKKFTIAIDAIRSMVGIDDDQRVNTIVDSTIKKIKKETIADEKSFTTEKKKKPAVSEKSPAAHTFSRTLAHTRPKSKQKSKPFFDIKEENSIMTLIKKIEENNKFAKLVTEKKKPEKVEEQVKEIEQVFNDIFVEETTENLNFLQNSLELAKQGESLGEAIMRIKEACSSLKDSAQVFNISPVQEPLTLLDQLAKKKLTFNKQPSPEVLDLIAEVEEAVFKFIKRKETNFSSLNNKLKKMLVDKVEKSEDIIGEPENRETTVRKKVKVVFNEDDDKSMRWISKFK